MSEESLQGLEDQHCLYLCIRWQVWWVKMFEEGLLCAHPVQGQDRSRIRTIVLFWSYWSSYHFHWRQKADLRLRTRVWREGDILSAEGKVFSVLYYHCVLCVTNRLSKHVSVSFWHVVIKAVSCISWTVKKKEKQVRQSCGREGEGKKMCCQMKSENTRSNSVFQPENNFTVSLLCFEFLNRSVIPWKCTSKRERDWQPILITSHCFQYRSIG